MTYPSEFYHKQTGSSKSYTDSPTGELDVGRLIEGQPCWVSASSSEILKPKKLILSDWSAVNWSKWKIEEVQERLGKLLDDQFELFLWQNGKVIPLLREDLSSLNKAEVREAISLAPTQEVLEAAVQQQPNLTYDTLQVLDDYWLRRALGHTMPEGDKRFIFLSDLGACLDDGRSTAQKVFNLKTLLGVLSQSKPKPEFVFVRDHFPSIKDVGINLDGINLDGLNDYSVVPMYKEMNLDRMSVSLLDDYRKRKENFTDVEDLEFDSSINDDILRQIFEHKKSSPLTLKRLRWCQYSINWDLLEDYLKLHPNLNSLSIMGFNNIKCTFTPNSFPQISSLELGCCLLGLKQILEATPNLKTLKLLHPMSLVVSHEDQSKIFEQLEFLSLEGTGISFSNFSYFLKNACNLKKLDITNCPLAVFNNEDLNKLEGLKSVEELDLSGIKLDGLSLSSLELASIKALSKVSKKLKSIKFPYMQKADENEVKKLFPEGVKVDFYYPEDTHEANLTRDRYTLTESDPIHNPLSMKDFIPTSENKCFEFIGENKTKNQGMIIEKFCHYLSLKNKHLDIIPKLQDGICSALSHYYVENPYEFNRFMQQVSAWTGEQISSEGPLSEMFETLHGYVTKYKLKSESKPWQYLGENLVSFVESCQFGTSYVLQNPWHAIGIRRLDRDNWEVYDPNFVQGPHKVSHQYLLSTLNNSLGAIIGVLSDQSVTPQIGDEQTFIQQGGLLALYHSANVLEMMEQIWPNIDYSKESLDGLLLRNVEGTPAWVHAIKLPQLYSYTVDLLGQFIAKNPTDSMQQLKKSLECLSDQRRGECIENLIQKLGYGKAQKASELIVQKLVEAIRTAPKFIPSEEYDGLLRTWSSKKAHFDSAPEYCQHSLEYSDKTKRLIQLSSTQEIEAMQYVLQDTAQKISRPVFYINSPKDLVCSSAFVTRQDDDKGVLTAGPGGPLYNFLDANKDKRPVLIVNYEQFSSEDIVRCNSLLDAEARVDGAFLPKDTLVIGLINTNKPDCYQGADFYSRFDRRETCPLSKELLLDQLPALPVSEFIPAVSINPALPVIPVQAGIHPQDGSVATAEMGSRLRGKDSLVINLYHAFDWKECLVGRWILKGQDLVFQKGALEEALAEKRPIEIQNAPWDNLEFQQFWRQALLTGSVDNGRIKIPKNLQLIRGTEGYDWGHLKSSVCFEPGLSQEAIILNPNRFGEFFNHYVCEEHSLSSEDGFIKAASGKDLHVNLTRELSEDSWAKLLAVCKEHEVSLVVHCAAGVAPHEGLGSCPKVEPLALQNTRILVSTDIDTTVAQYTTEGSWTVIDVSECKASDIMLRIDGRLIEGNPPHFKFEEQSSVLIEALKANKNILLKGHFSPELADELGPLLMSREDGAEVSGSLVLVTEDHDSFNYLKQQRHLVTDEEKETLLGEVPPALKPFIAKESLSQLKVRQAFWKTHLEDQSSDTAWAGLDRLPGGIPDLGSLDVNTSKKESEQFTQERLSAVRELLDRDHYVFLTGLSGVGKSTFVTKDFCEEGDRLYTGDKSIEEWAKDKKTTGRTLLFLDEANLINRGWSEFEGLFQNPPSILIRGVLHTLTPSHQVIFAGNPLSYGDERTLAPFFRRHGNAVVFSPLTPAVLYEKSLKPVFEKSPLEAQAEKICTHILKVYAYLCQCSTKDALISPRELQMIALLVQAAYQRNPSLDPLELTKHYAYQLGVSLLAHSELKENRFDFEAKFKPSSSLERPELSQLKDFLITLSRKGIKQQLDDLLSLREVRQEGNDAQKYGGLGGILLEGPPGVGKSELVIATLVSRGYKEKDIHNEESEEGHIFYRMPVSLSLKEKEALLRKAFDEGAVVIIDEINSSPMMERLLNDLLMGKTPENKRPKHTGFMVIGTQNPVTMAGRRAPSTALARRLIKAELPDYPVQEIQSILEAKGLPANKALALAEAFTKQRDYALSKHLSPAPTFRDLLKAAEPEVKAAEQKVKVECFGLVIAIGLTGFGEQDFEMNKFLNDINREISKAVGIAYIKKLHEQLKSLKAGLCSDLNQPLTQVQYLHKVIENYRNHAGAIFSVGMRKKAAKIEDAIRSVPVDKRVDILKSESGFALNVRKALAMHRYWGKQGKVYTTNTGTIDEKKAATTFIEMNKQFQNINKDTLSAPSTSEDQIPKM